jgi:hypothetical protein
MDGHSPENKETKYFSPIFYLQTLTGSVDLQSHSSEIVYELGDGQSLDGINEGGRRIVTT